MTTFRLAGLAAAACAFGSEAAATAFQLREGSATAIGTALAGRTANDRDVSLAIQNPAALRGVETGAVSAGAAFIYATADAKATAAPPGFSATDDPSENAIVPSLIAGWRLSPQWVVGIAVDSPFGLATEYSKTFIGAFDGVRSELTTITATPMVAYSPVPQFTVAAGLSVQYAEAELTSRVGLATPDTASVEGDGVELGFTLGFAFEPAEGTSIGLAVQTGFSHELEGELSDNFPVPPGVAPGSSGIAAFELPPVVSLGLIQQVAPGIRAMAEVEWTGWSSFKNILITDDATGITVLDDRQEYEDSFMASIGGEYDLNPALTLRAGLGYDKTPTRDAFRTVRTPDSDRYWLSAGASYEITERIGIDIGYTYIIVDDTQVSLRNVPGVRVDYSNGSVHLLQTNLRYEF